MNVGVSFLGTPRRLLFHIGKIFFLEERSRKSRHLLSLDAVASYAAFKAHGARFDGHLFISVSSAGIY